MQCGHSVIVIQEFEPSTPDPSQTLSQISSYESRLRLSFNRSRPDKSSRKNATRPFFGLIVDGVHSHSSSVKIAYQAYLDGAILVTDAMRLAECPDGTYDWTNRDHNE